MSQILVPDFDATEEIDPELVRLEWELELTPCERIGTGMLSDTRQRAAQQCLDDYKADPVSTRLIIGYLPPEKLTMIKHRTWEAQQMTTDQVRDAVSEQVQGAVAVPGKLNIDQVRAFDEINRTICLWGVRGWRDMQGPDGKPFPFEGCKELFGHAGPRDLRVVDHFGWLGPMARRILRYNTLDESKKKA